MVNDNVSLISFSDSSLLAYRNGKDFCVLTLYPANLPNPLMSSSNFLVESLGFSMYSIISSVQSFSHVRLFATSWTAAHQASLSIINSWSLLKFMSIASVMPSNHVILRHTLLLPPSTFPSIRVFSNESVVCIRWPKCWSFGFSISPSDEYSGLISFRLNMVWSLCSARNSQESSPTPQFKSINSLVLSFLYGPTLTSIRDYGKKS